MKFYIKKEAIEELVQWPKRKEVYNMIILTIASFGVALISLIFQIKDRKNK